MNANTMKGVRSMRKYFCNKCEKEIKDFEKNDSIVEGYIQFPDRSRHKIWVEFEAEKNEHICRSCLIDAIVGMDYRRIYDNIINKPKFKKAPCGLHSLGGIVE